MAAKFIMESCNVKMRLAVMKVPSVVPSHVKSLLRDARVCCRAVCTFSNAHSPATDLFTPA